MNVIVRFIVTIAVVLSIGAQYVKAQDCICPDPVPACPPVDPACPTATWTSGMLQLPVPVGTGSCILMIHFCSRNTTGTPCGYGLPYGVSCEYRVTKVCFPPECEVDCGSVEMNSILQNAAIAVAKYNPHGHFVPTSAQWNDTITNYKTAWKLGFPACYQCELEPGTNCKVLTGCDNSTCYKWYEAYKCGPACPTAVPPCANPCPAGIQFNYIPGSQGKTTFECQNPVQCVLCGY